MADQVYISCTNASPIQVYVNRGKITRIRPLFFDDTDSASWIIDLGNRKITPPRQTTMAPHDLVERLRVYRGPHPIPFETKRLRPFRRAKHGEPR
jgi:hypothetical protein